MLCISDQGRYGNLAVELKNDFTKGNNYYPAKMLEAWNLLVNYNTMHSKTETRMLDES